MRPPREKREEETQEGRPPAAQEIGVVEVDVGQSPEPARAGMRERGLRASGSSGRRAAAPPTASGSAPAQRAPPTARRSRDTADGTRAECSPRSRAPHTRRRRRRPCTSRRRRRASARDRRPAATHPPGERARPPCANSTPGSRRPMRRRASAVRGRARSSACGGRAAPASPPRGRARATRPRPPRPPRSGGRMSAAIANPPGRRRCSAEKRAHTSSSSGRSTWQETTAYRSADVPRMPVDATADS